MSKYAGMPDHDILIVVAEATDRQEKHLAGINGTLQNHEKRLMKAELRREVEEETGFKLPSKRKKFIEGSMHGGAGALVISALYALGHVLSWW